MNNQTWALDTENLDSNGDTYNYKEMGQLYYGTQFPEIEADWREHTGARTLMNTWKQTFQACPEPPTPQEPSPMSFLCSGTRVADCIKTNS